MTPTQSNLFVQFYSETIEETASHFRFDEATTKRMSSIINDRLKKVSEIQRVEYYGVPPSVFCCAVILSSALDMRPEVQAPTLECRSAIQSFIEYGGVPLKWRVRFQEMVKAYFFYQSHRALMPGCMYAPLYVTKFLEIMGVQILSETETMAQAPATEVKEDFYVGQRVRKVTGEYNITGIIRSIFQKGDGATRMVVEHNAEGGGSFLHIYGPNNLKAEPLEDQQS